MGIIGVVVFAPAFSQEIVSISKNDVLNKVTNQNLQSKLSNQEIKIAEAEVLSARASYLPNISASYTAMGTNNPLMAFGSKLNQANVVMDDFNPVNLNNPSNIMNYATKIELQQPIINRDAVYQKKAGLVKIESLKIKKERTIEYLKYEVSKAYMQLQLAYKAVEVLEGAKVTTLANKKTIDNYFKNGMVQKSDVLYIDIRVAEIENQIKYAKSNIQNASDYIYFLMDEESNNKILKPSDFLSHPKKEEEVIPKINTSRSDIKAYKKSMEVYDLMIKSSKAKRLPRLNAFGSFEIYDNKPYQFDANGYLVGIQLSWNIFDGLKSKSEQTKLKADLDKLKTEVQQYEKQSQLELNKMYRQVNDANNKVSLSQLSWEQSKEAYRIKKNRFDQGLEKPSDVLNAETQMAQKELEYYQSIYEYNSAVEYYQFLK